MSPSLSEIRREAARYHATFGERPRSCSVTPLGKVRHTKSMENCRHVVIGTYTNKIPLNLFVADVIEAWGEMRDDESV